MATVGNVSIMYVQSLDQLGNVFETNVSKGLKVNPEVTYNLVDTAARRLVQLTTNTYQDTILVTNISVNDVLAEGGD